MKLLRKSIVTALLAGSVGTVAAQQVNAPTRGMPDFASFDTDGDGMISEQEFNSVREARGAGRAAHYERMQQRRPMQGPGRGYGPGMGYGPRRGYDFERVYGPRRSHGPEMGYGPRRSYGPERGYGPRRSYGPEWGYGPRRGYGRGMDYAPGRGYGPGMGGGRNMPVFSDFDLDGNGLIGEQEFLEGHAVRIRDRAEQGYAMRGLSDFQPFSALDQNGDGNLTPEEFAAAQAKRRQARFR